ncbi:hypothetical protein C8Q78DRAFT_17309 [Trametes maxima]|nr:hypothetical protein C8Q78DRAFT_17309 [Trametes maxima]
MPPRGRPPKRKCDTTGLRNHQNPSSSVPKEPDVASAECSEDDGKDSAWEDSLVHDSLKPVFAHDSADLDVDEESEWEDLDTEPALEKIMKVVRDLEDDVNDESWLPSGPYHKRKWNEARRVAGGRPKEYAKGPDILSKAPRTQRRYRKLLEGQTKLNGFVSITPRVRREAADSEPAHRDDSSHENLEPELVTDGMGGHDPGLGALPSDTIPANAVIDSEQQSPGTDEEDEWEADEELEGLEDVDDCIEMEAGINEAMRGGVSVKTWKELLDQIKKDLKKDSQKMTLAQINQLNVLRAFSILRLKGMHAIRASLEIARQWHENTGTHFARRVRALARHYQVFEHLPREKRGGKRDKRSYLHDESIRRAARDWLSAQAVGEVTPRCFQQSLNTTILPSLNVQLRQPLSERTARRWLIKLGWRRTTLRKGVYMDGHERPDVVKYHEVYQTKFEGWGDGDCHASP